MAKDDSLHDLIEKITDPERYHVKQVVNGVAPGKHDEIVDSWIDERRKQSQIQGPPVMPGEAANLPPLAPGAPAMRPAGMSGEAQPTGSLLQKFGAEAGRVGAFVEQLNPQEARKPATVTQNQASGERPSPPASLQSERLQSAKTPTPDSGAIDSANLKLQIRQDASAHVEHPQLAKTPAPDSRATDSANFKPQNRQDVSTHGSPSTGEANPQPRNVRDTEKYGRSTADHFLPAIQLTEQRGSAASLNADKPIPGKPNVETGKADDHAGARHGDLKVFEKHSATNAQSEHASSSIRDAVGPRAAGNSVSGAVSPSRSNERTRPIAEPVERSVGEKNQQQTRHQWGVVAPLPTDVRSGQTTAGPNMVPAQSFGSSGPRPEILVSADEKLARATTPGSVEQRSGGPASGDVGYGAKAQAGSPFVRNQCMDAADTQRHEVRTPASDTNRNPVGGPDKRMAGAGEPGSLRSEGRLDSAEKIGTASTASRGELPVDKAGQASPASPRTDAATGKAAPAQPVDQSKIPGVKPPSAIGATGPDFPVVLPPRFTAWDFGIKGGTKKSDSAAGLTDRNGAIVKSPIDVTQPPSAGRRTVNEGHGQPSQTSIATDKSGKVVKPVRSDSLDDRTGSVTRVSDPGSKGNKQNGSTCAPEKPNPAKDRRGEQNTPTTQITDVQLNGLAVRLFADLQGLLASFVRSIKDSARPAQPNRPVRKESTEGDRNDNTSPTHAEIRTRGPGAPPKLTADANLTSPLDNDAADALIAFVKANRKLLEGALESDPSSNVLIEEFAKLINEIDGVDTDEGVSSSDVWDPDLSLQADAAHPNQGRENYIVRAGETLDSIAHDLFNDVRISYVIYEINKADLPATLTDGTIYRQLNPGTLLYLPSASEINRFLAYYADAQAC